ncbi:hypothetical protein EXIGLDRAFT_702195 [Exidia glandulosa HHB12029]|uniref:Uncharacterized protein n=1 Tax=Exidia glandulosa HHB12029 TaxID=1314781 RepID=A0A165CNJ2_EXIGL|nr:hypothetical protein EXIGLDRAFT_702195 [Exidia glandulosa HHB12029]
MSRPSSPEFPSVPGMFDPSPPQGTAGPPGGNLFLTDPAALSRVLGNSPGFSAGSGSVQAPQRPTGSFDLLLPMLSSLTRKLQLSPEFTKELYAFAKMGNRLQPDDLMLRIYTQAHLFKLRMTTAPASDNSVAILAFLKKWHGEVVREWRPSAEQMSGIRIAAKEILFQPRRMDFCTLNKDVMLTSNQEHLKKEKVDLGFVDAFTSPTREGLVASATGPICSSVRNNFRTAIRDSLFKKKKIDLITFTKNSCDGYLPSGTTTLINENSLYVLKCALLRRYALDNPEKVRSKGAKQQRSEQVDFPGSDDSRGADAEPSEQTLTAGSNKRRLNETQDRDDHFWLAVEKWLEALSVEHGGWDWNTPRWRRIISYFSNLLLKEKNEVADFPITSATTRATSSPITAPAELPTFDLGASSSSNAGDTALADIWEAFAASLGQ